MTSINRFRRFIDARVQPPYLFVVSVSVVLLTLILAAVQFATAEQGRTVFGVPLGADFSGFFVAAQILNRGEPAHLYDRTLHHRLYHELLPHEDERTEIPYVHPPFVAGLLRPMAWLPYSAAFAIWLMISATIFLASIELLRKVLNCPEMNQRLLILLMAFSFEPFAMECWLGGQLSAIASLMFALSFAAMQRSRPILAGVALGICFYKPTLLLLILPMLLLGKRWKILLGMTIAGLILAMLSLVFVGWDVSLDYLHELQSFRKNTSNGDLEIRTWKYVDVNNGLRMMLGAGSRWQLPLFVLVSFVPCLLLARLWWQSGRFDEESQRLLWAATITWTPVLNLYFGIYDSILVIQSVLITAAVILRSTKDLTPLMDSTVDELDHEVVKQVPRDYGAVAPSKRPVAAFRYIVVLIYVAPWFSQHLAAMSGIPVYTLLLMALGVYQLCRLCRARPVSAI